MENETVRLDVETLLRDANGNSASVKFFGSYAKAYAALQTLKNCFNCENCFNCTGCTNCVRCEDCHICSGSYMCKKCTSVTNCAGLIDRVDEEEEVDDAVIPVIPNIHQKVYSAITAKPDAFNMSIWHGLENGNGCYDSSYCGTTHCRAGWVTHLVGLEYKTIERILDTPEFARRIYKKSGYEISADYRFNQGAYGALKDMKYLAELEEIGQAPKIDPKIDPHIG